MHFSYSCNVSSVCINLLHLSVSKIATLIHGFDGRLANRPFSRLSARVSERQKLKTVGSKTLLNNEYYFKLN